MITVDYCFDADNYVIFRKYSPDVILLIDQVKTYVEVVGIMNLLGISPDQWEIVCHDHSDQTA